MWRKAMVYLGLGDDSEYESYDDPMGGPEESDGPARAPGRPPSAGHSSMGPVTPVPHGDDPSGIGTVRPIGAREGGDGPVTGQTSASGPAGSGPSSTIRPRPQVVRQIAATPTARPSIVIPTSFNEAQELADKFKGGQPVVVNLQDGDRELSRRLIDFASGLCYGLGGQMERLANQVYLVTPAGIEVSEDERRRLRDRGYDT